VLPLDAQKSRFGSRWKRIDARIRLTSVPGVPEPLLITGCLAQAGAACVDMQCCGFIEAGCAALLEQVSQLAAPAIELITAALANIKGPAGVLSGISASSADQRVPMPALA
jgi:hypothetical protein